MAFANPSVPDAWRLARGLTSVLAALSSGRLSSKADPARLMAAGDPSQVPDEKGQAQAQAGDLTAHAPGGFRMAAS